MAENAESSSDAQITFKVKTSSDSTHSITMPETASVLELKTKLAGQDLENVPVERQRLIYSGRVMKNDDPLSNYKIKHNNTIHMVKSAASNPSQPAANSSAPTPPAVPTNMASGTANNPLAGLTGARYAGHQINLPGLDMFGPDGGMGPPMDEERIQQMMSDPNVQQTMNEALNNPDFVNMLIENNPMLRNVPNAREIITSPFMRQMMSNPQMMSQAMRMQRGMQRGDSAFPAPGATDTSAGAAATGGANQDNSGTAGGDQNQANPFMNPFMMSGMLGGQQQPPNNQNLLQQLQGFQQALQGLNQQMGARGAAATPGTDSTAQTTTPSTAPGTTEQGTQQNTTSPAPENPFAALFGTPSGAQANPFGMNMNPELMQQMMQLMGGAGGGAPAAPADNRPPEERYADQLRQLNDMGFFDFDRNVAALRRSGGSVQGAIEHLLSGP